MVMAIAMITALCFKNKKKNDRHNMKNKKFDRLVAESTRRSLTESQRIDEWGNILKGGKNLWKGFQAARKGTQAIQGSRAANAGYKMAQGMGFGRKAAQAELNAVKRANELGAKMNKGIALSAQEAEEMEKLRKMLPSSNPLGDVLNTSDRLMRLQRNANRWRTAGVAGLAGLAGYGLGGGSGEAPGADMAGAGMDGTYPGTDMAGAGMYGTYPGGGYGNGMYPGGSYPGDGMYPNGGYGDGFYDPDPNSLYAYMGDYPYWYGDPYGYGYDYPYGYGYGGAYNDGGMDPMMMYYMMNGGWGY